MYTKVFENSIGSAPEIIRNGGLVAVPTETVYGLAANGLDALAVENAKLAAQAMTDSNSVAASMASADEVIFASE